MRKRLFYIMIMLPVLLPAQEDREDYLYEFRGTTENDNYSFTFNDGYYTNGLMFHFTTQAKWKTTKRLVKVISAHSFGQQIFVSETWKNRSVQTIDRPLSGYLFFQKDYHFFFRKGHVLQTGLAAGATGRSSFAEQVQSWYHNALGLPEVEGWPLQLNGELALNLYSRFDYNLLGLSEKQRLFEIMFTGNASLGNAFTNAAGGVQIRFGNFENPFHSAFYKARTGRGTGEKLKRNAEVFIYFHPQVVYQGYNATVQGPLFKKEKGPLVSEISRGYYQHAWGIQYSQRRWLMDIHFVRKNKEATSMRDIERFASISFAYRFGRIKQKTEPGFGSVLK